MRGTSRDKVGPWLSAGSGVAVGGSGVEVGAIVGAAGASEAPQAIKSDAITTNPKTKCNNLGR